MFRPAVALAALALALTPAVAAAQSAGGPYLRVETDAQYVVLIDVASRHRTAEGWSALSITVFDIADVGQARVDTQVVANCTEQTRRTDELIIRAAPDADQPGDALVRGRALDWTPMGPGDGPLMAFLCEGQYARADARPRVSDQVKIWRGAD